MTGEALKFIERRENERQDRWDKIGRAAKILAPTLPEVHAFSTGGGGEIPKCSLVRLFSPKVFAWRESQIPKFSNSCISHIRFTLASLLSLY